MDRFSWSDGQLGPSETLVTQRIGVRIYDGDTKTSFDYGSGILTTHKLIWRDYRDQRCVISMSLSQVVYAEEEAASFSKSAKIVIHLSAASPDKAPGPVTSSPHSHIKLSFKEGGQTDFFRCLSEELQRKRWEHEPAAAMPTQPGQARKVRAGIVGIERGIQQKHKDTDQSISKAFEDLSNLMEKAKEMVKLSKNISSKIKDKQGDITEDETVRFKSYLLSMGIPDPVTRETHGTGNNYYRELAKQLSTMLQEPLKECGGLMTLTDVYCRVNRARGMELLSPEDLVNACKLLEPMQLPIRFRTFDSGVMVVELLSHSEAEIIKQTKQIVNEQTSITAEELSKLVGVSVVLSKERLLGTEKAGHLCRDESVEGLRFYPNLFLTKVAS